MRERSCRALVTLRVTVAQLVNLIYWLFTATNSPSGRLRWPERRTQTISFQASSLDELNFNSE